VDELEFYSAAAQIIPVLLLALVLEGRLFELEERAERLPESLWIIAFVGAMLVGEVSALSALEAGRRATALEKRRHHARDLLRRRVCRGASRATPSSRTA
jgi:hypothetical protein